MKNILFIYFFCLISNFSIGQVKKYCYSTYSGTYSLSLFDDGTKKVVYQLYNTAGVLQKTMQGEWILRDEGVYGTAYMLTVTWTGANIGMQELKFVAQYDGYGSLQGIIDSQSRTWNSCRQRLEVSIGHEKTLACLTPNYKLYLNDKTNIVLGIFYRRINQRHGFDLYTGLNIKFGLFSIGAELIGFGLDDNKGFG